MIPWWGLAAGVLGVNFAVTRSSPALKRRGIRLFQKYVVNPPVRILVGLGLLFTGPMAGVWPLTVEDQVNTGLEASRTGTPRRFAARSSAVRTGSSR